MIFLFLGILVIIIGIISYFIDDNNFCIILFISGGVFVGFSFSERKHENLPTPLDVYQGKTTLEITYRDSIPVDSVVVFKNK